MNNILKSLLVLNQIKKAGITLDIEKGDTLLGGRFKNVPMVVDEVGTDELGQPTVNGRKLLAYRIQKKMPKSAAVRFVRPPILTKDKAANLGLAAAGGASLVAAGKLKEEAKK